jgi:zinc transport system ATP-binding protein
MNPQGADGPALVEIINVSVRRYREQLLSGVSLSVNRGSVHAIVGPNGAGKTTLLVALLGQIPFDGRIVAHWRRDGRIGYVPQALIIDPSLPVTVEDFLALTRQRRPVCFGITADVQRRATALLNEVGLRGLEHRPLSVLSGGELRRVLLAHALDPIPELLILDEPASGLDESGLQQLEGLLRTLVKRGATVLMVSHDLEQVRRVANRVTVLDRSVITEGPAMETLAQERVVALLPSGGQGRARR